MKINRLISISGVMILSILLAPDVNSASEELLIITHRTTPVSHISSRELQDIYSNSKTKWSNNDKILIVLFLRGDVHEAFVNDLLRTTSRKLNSVWKRVIFTGVGTPPKIVRTESEMLEYVSNTKGAIGYINSKSINNKVKILSLK